MTDNRHPTDNSIRYVTSLQTTLLQIGIGFYEHCIEHIMLGDYALREVPDNKHWYSAMILSQ